MKQKIICLLILLWVIFLTGKCDKGDEHQTNQTISEKISIGIQNNTIAAMILVAQGQNFFQKNSIDVTIKKYPSGKLALQGMFNQEVNIATATEMPVMINSFQRKDFQIIASVASTYNGAWIIARKDKGISKPADLQGKTIATQKSSAVHFFLSLFLLHNHILESEVNIQFLRAVDLPSALIKGEIDAFSMRNPFINIAKKKLGDNAIELFEPYIYRMTFNLLSGKTFIQKHSNTIEKLILALLDAENFIKSHQEKAIEITAHQLGKGKIQEVREDWDSFLFQLSLDQTLLLELEDQARWAIKNQLVGNKKIPNYLNFIYLDALKHLHSEAVEIIH